VAGFSFRFIFCFVKFCCCSTQLWWCWWWQYVTRRSAGESRITMDNVISVTCTTGKQYNTSDCVSLWLHLTVWKVFAQLKNWM